MQHRSRILRANPAIRSLVAETGLTANDFIVPLFIEEGKQVRSEIKSMPGYFRNSLDLTVGEVKELYGMGLKSILLFVKCKEEWKDNTGKEAWNRDGLMQRSIRAIKEAVPDMLIMTDVALDPYSSYGHDGIVKDGEIVNDETVEALVKMSISHAEAGADFVAPSDMMDGRMAPSEWRLRKTDSPKPASWPTVQNTPPVSTDPSGMPWIPHRDSVTKKPTRWIMPTAPKP